MTNLEALYNDLRRFADDAATAAKARRATNTEDGLKDAEFQTGRHAAFLTVIHILQDNFGVMPAASKRFEALTVDDYAEYHRGLNETLHGLGDFDGGGE